MSEDAVPFGERLRRLREAAGLTQERLAEKAGLSVQGIASLERGRSRRPYPHTVRSLADALDLSTEDRALLLAAIPDRDQRDAEEMPARNAEGLLPALESPLFGRDGAMAEIRALITSGTRLLTLTGPGGVGKTSLALHAAEALADHFPDGATFVPVAALVDPDLLLPTIARTLGLADTGSGATLASLQKHLQGTRMLLVLDNLEQILDAATDISDLLRACNGLVVIATSRAPLRIRIEREYPVQPLAVPALDHIPQVREVAGAAAVELFVERARDANPGFRLEQENAASVAAICRRLDGLPLAIELAAARLRLLSPLELLARLDAALPLLSDGARDLPERQRTMARAIEWSHDLLGDGERTLFQRLSVFRGGWSIDVADAIGATMDVPDRDILNSLSSLVEQSLVVVDHAPNGHTRYRMLEPIREFAARQLDGSGDARDIRNVHAGYFLALSEQAAAGLEDSRQVEWLTRLERERNNLRAALDWLVANGCADEATRLCWNLWVFLWIRGDHAEARAWMTSLLEQVPDASPATRARASGIAAAMSFALGDIPTALHLAEESEENLHSLGDRIPAARCRLVLGLIASARDDATAASRWLEPAAAVFREHGLWFWAALSTIALGMIPYREGRYDAAEKILAEGYHLSRTANDRFSRYIALYDMSRLAQVRGELHEAARLFHEGFVFSIEVGDRANMASCLEGLASVAVMHHDPHLAARLLGRAESLFQAAGSRVYTYRPDTLLRETTLDTVRQQLSSDALAFEWREGAQMSIDELMDLAAPLTDSRRPVVTPLIPPPPPTSDMRLRTDFGLTRRELEILKLLMAHHSYREIADALFISPRTVGAHVTSIHSKMGVSSRHEAARLATETGLF